MANETKEQTLADYAEHWWHCNALTCSECGMEAEDHEDGDEEHAFDARECSCGLDALLAEPQPSLSAAVETLEKAKKRAHHIEHKGRGFGEYDALVALREGIDKAIQQLRGVSVEKERERG